MSHKKNNYISRMEERMNLIQHLIYIFPSDLIYQMFQQVVIKKRGLVGLAWPLIQVSWLSLRKLWELTL